MKKIISLLLMACVLLSSMSVFAESEYQCRLEWIIEPTEEFSNVVSAINENLYVFETDEGWGLIDKDGNMISPSTTDLFYYDNCFMGTVTKEPHEWGIYDYSGNEIIPPIYPYRSFSVCNNYIITYVEKTEAEIEKLLEESGWNGNYGIGQGDRIDGYGAYDYEGNIIIPFEYEYLFPTGSSELLIAKKNGKYGIMDHLCNTVLPFEYDIIEPLYYFDFEDDPDRYRYDDYCLAEKDGKAALVYKGRLSSNFEDVNSFDFYSLVPESSYNTEYNPYAIADIKETEAGYVIVDKYSNPLHSDAYTDINANDNVVVVETLNGKKGVLKVVTNEITMGINNYKANVFGETVMNDTYPIIINNRTMLPIRFVAEALGATVGWEPSTQSVTITKDSTEINLQIGNNVATKNGAEITLDTVPFIENGRTYLPVRFISEELGADVEWIPETRSVVIRK